MTPLHFYLHIILVNTFYIYIPVLSADLTSTGPISPSLFRQSSEQLEPSLRWYLREPVAKLRPYLYPNFSDFPPNMWNRVRIGSLFGESSSFKDNHRGARGESVPSDKKSEKPFRAWGGR